MNVDWGGILSLEMRRVVLPALVVGLCLLTLVLAAPAEELLKIQAAGFTLATNSEISTGTE
jgi:putative effector of murein hydrolase LrgA (UPF0299 family)